jgi:hypothetical protein
MVRQAAEIIQKIEALPAAEQEVLARFLADHFQEVLQEARWQHLLNTSPDTLDQLVAEVDQAIAKGEVAPLDPDEL